MTSCNDCTRCEIDVFECSHLDREKRSVQRTRSLISSDLCWSSCARLTAWMSYSVSISCADCWISSIDAWCDISVVKRCWRRTSDQFFDREWELPSLVRFLSALVRYSRLGSELCVHMRVQFLTSVHGTGHTCVVDRRPPSEQSWLGLIWSDRLVLTVWRRWRNFRRCRTFVLAFFQCWVNCRTCRRTLRKVKSERFLSTGEDDGEPEAPPVSSSER